MLEGASQPQYLNLALTISVRGLPKLSSCAFGVVPWT